jgi:hypothetical protein
MKKIVCALVVLALAASASAVTTVDITIAQDAPGEPNATISYATSGGNVRCFGLDIQLDNDETIIAVECLSDDYYVNPQKFTYDGMNPDFGTIPCLCNADDGLLDGLDSNGITISMCSLYAESDPDHNEAPATSNGLVRVTLSGSACITITENDRLGGVLDEDNVDVDPTFPPDPCCIDAGCQCWGDISGPTVGVPDNMVSTSDLSYMLGLLGAAGAPYQVCPVPAGYECMDISGPTVGQQDGCITTSDLSALLVYFGGIGAPYQGPCMAAPAPKP